LKAKILEQKDEISELKTIIQHQSKSLQHQAMQIFARDEILIKLRYERDFFKNNDKRSVQLTGLTTWTHLDSLFKRVEADLTPVRMHKLTVWQTFISTLMRLRSGCTARDIGYRFDISEATAGRAFYVTINVLYHKLQPLVAWPEREKIIASMPKCFRIEFGNVVSIVIDCFEIKTETPEQLDAKSAMYSHYKSHNTLKVLIGITPDGVIAFISEGFTGHTSDNFITTNSGLMEKLEPGDVIMCDRGFTIQEAAADKLASIIIPAFRHRGEYQLSAIAIEETRNIGNVRIHVERCISTLRQKYEILSKILPITLLTTHKKSNSPINKILLVCSALVNLCPSIVPRD
jgi:DDE superfamily endonuclease/Helix-turn-helix of DDE superfamily endonuclease